MAAQKSRQRNPCCFLDISIGDLQAFEQQQQEYQRGKRFLKLVGDANNLGTSLEELDEPGREKLLSLFSAADIAWTNQGSIRTHAPTSPHVGRLIIELFVEDAPKTSENFRALCTGEKGSSKSGKLLHYKNSKFHRIEKGFMCQGGDITLGNGTGGESIYGGKFNDEKGAFKFKHGGPGVVAMANSGKNSNASQFYITFAAAPKEDGKHVIFGRVIDGFDVLKQIEEQGRDINANTTSNDNTTTSNTANADADTDTQPLQDVTITNCGQLLLP